MTTTEAPGTAASTDTADTGTPATGTAAADSGAIGPRTTSVADVVVNVAGDRPGSDDVLAGAVDAGINQGNGARASRRHLTAAGAPGGHPTAAGAAAVDGATRSVSRLGRSGPRHAAQRALLERNRALTLIHSGQATTATVDTLCDTGVRVNGRAVAEVHLLVDRPGGAPYPVVRSAVLPDVDMDFSRAAIASSGRPRRIPVLVDPRRPENVLLRWDLRPAS
ncbi:hypothetical protein [Frankia sp. QA3]|uniref:hypothetical protein n=1 Tax=Frankia sp. QA3 TaxID=710111 RepID=UPI000269C978|nr:hypothetical protein [Frankia sp. QA3]EIV93746.1 hypothetical protein FraQA3DRAFT_3458 [Frankia sp. QA3]